ncbi:MAG: hypothetical protein ACKVY0_25990 [Prosthecobacter sp.]|uniref:hypothetical protein n=1 Tax=Prosthecobacter sp. TaxID=1965333 RepID=UPI0039019EBD
MIFESFGRICPEIAKAETWRFTLPKPQGGLQAGHYGFLEYFCTDATCDCRRVWLGVEYFSKWPPGNSPGTYIATIGYGWETPEFYLKWSHGEPTAADLAGARLEPFQRQSAAAAAALAMTKSVILSSLGNVLRLRQHYATFRAKLPRFR